MAGAADRATGSLLTPSGLCVGCHAVRNQFFVDEIPLSPHSGSMSPLATVQSVLAKPFMPAVFFFSGVAYDTLTLPRIDRLQDNLLLLL